MGELVRRMDYERRSKKRLAIINGSGQRINREYSAPVRAANDMEERKCHLLVQTMERHKQLFLNRCEYEKKVVLKFKDDLDAKSENFSEAKYQHLRAQSALSRLQSANQQANIGPVVEIVPRHYYRTETKSSAVKFDITPDSSDDGSSSEDDTDDKSSELDLATNPNRKSAEPKPTGFSTTIHWATLTKKPPSAELRRRRVSLGLESHRFLPARGVRRQSAPPRVMSALEPRDVRSSRRNSPSLAGSLTSLNENVNNSDNNDVSSRSFRLLKETFKKKKLEKPNPKADKLNSVKADHLNKTTNMYERTMEKFDKLFNETVFLYY
ncbi:hypothetical protein ACF0H5_017699 [Mactra antiquata]